MKIPINLASQPYANLRPLYNAIWVAAALLIGLTLLVLWEDRQIRNETHQLTEQIDELQQEMDSLQEEQEEMGQWLATPQVQQTRNQSTFLNSLILRKSVSWTRIFMDLGKILPNQAQVTAIRPSLNQFQQAELNLSVAAVQMGPLIQFLKNLESSPRFGSPAVESQQFPSERAADRNIMVEVKAGYYSFISEPDPEVEDSITPAPVDDSEELANIAPMQLEKEKR